MSKIDELLSKGSTLSPTKRALLEKWARGTSTNRVIPRRQERGPAPLSFAQQRLWFLDQLETGSSIYNVPVAVRLTGPLNLVVLERSLNEIMRRHDVLRTTFPIRDGQAVQVVAPAQAAPIRMVDLRGLAPAEREPEALRLATEETRRPFDLARGPLVRTALVHLDEDVHVAIVTMHHIVSDGWSMGVFVRELAALYDAFQSGRPSPLPELPIQYADFAVWQRAWLEGSGVRGHGDTETRRHADTEIGPSAETQPPTPNTQHPTPIQAQLDYWRAQLGDSPPNLELPTDHPRPRSQTFRGAALRFTLSAPLTQALAALCQREEATMFMALLAAFQTLLATYADQAEIIVGAPTAGRTQAELEGLIGFFVNTLVLRGDLSGNPTFRELLKRSREMTLGAFAHQDLPFERLVEELQSARDLSRNPLFQVVFSVQNAPVGALKLPDLILQPIELECTTTKFDLNLVFSEADGGLSGMLEYSTDLFEDTTIMRMAGQLMTLLDGIAADPARRLADLPLLTAAEREQIRSWQLHQAPAPQDAYVHQLVAAQAARSPDAIALVFDRPGVRGQGSGARKTRRHGDTETRRHGDWETARTPIPHPPSPIPQCLTYHELNTRAAQLARFLRSHGVGPDVRVAICLDPSPELVVALLGVLAAGGAFVPLDPAYPAERLAFMIEDSQAAVLITTNDRRPTTNDQRPTTDDQRPTTDDRRPTTDHPFTRSPVHPFTELVVDLDADWPSIAACPAMEPAPPLTPAHPAYLIYTSGSTGRPKAVLVEHRNLAHTLGAGQHAFGFQPSDVMPCLASIAFDIALFEIFGPLVAGGAVLLLPAAARLEPLQLLQTLQHCTCLHAVPSLMRQLVQAAQTRHISLAGMRMVFVGGERVPPDLLAALPSVFTQAATVVLYGPTEAAIISASYVVPRGQASDRALIGRPLPNVQLWLANAQRQPLPIGVPGELYIGGPGVTRGYLDRPDLTAERFIPNPFAGVLGDGCWVLEDSDPNTQHPTPNTRLYKTGDLARWLPDGVLEFLGRRDEQVKLRGYRIELGEVETALRQHPDVRACAVVARADAAGESRLVAYVVPRIEDRGLKIEDSGSSAPDPLSSMLYPLSSELRGFLQTRLPDYMVPSAFVLLDALPLTARGKLDRRALPEPAALCLAGAPAFVAPRTPIEALLARIWVEVLHVDQVGIHDQFFALGGHSLLAMQVVARVREALGVDVPVRALFEAPNIAELAAKIATLRQAAQGLVVPPLRRVARGDGPLPLSFAQQRLWFLDQLIPNSPVYNNCTAVRLSGRLDLPTLQRSLDEIMRRHEALRTSFPMVHGQPLQQIAPARPVPLPLVNLTHLTEVEREAAGRRLGAAEAQRPLELQRGLPVRIILLRLGETEHVLIFTIHHIVSDAWSTGVLTYELMTLYEAFSAGRPSPLRELELQYADFAVWQRQWLRGEALEIQLAYWRRRLSASPPVLELPSDRPRPKVQTYQGLIRLFALPASLSGELMTLSRREGVTLFMLLLAAFELLLHRYSRQDDILVGSPIANRSHSTIEPLIGFFVNMLVLRADTSGNPTFTAFLEQVRQVTIDAYAHQDLPFELMVEALQPKRDTGHTPFFQVVFALDNTPMSRLELPGLSLSSLPVESGTTRFDLTMSLRDMEQGLAGGIQYNSDLFDPTTIDRMIAHYQTLLEGIIADPARRLADLPLLTAAERQQIVEEWNATRTTYPDDAAVQQLFAAQAARTPDAIAVVFDRPTTNDQRPTTEDRGWKIEDGRSKIAGFPSSILDPQSSVLSPQSSVLSPQSLTYRELNERANRLAHHLQTLGVGPEMRVVICLERSPELIVGLLSILKAGGAYMPLDPAYPVERMAFMIEDSQASVLVTQSRLIDDLPAHWGPLVRLDDDWELIAQEPADDPAGEVSAQNLAYIMYTSGSTGVPKGICISHQAISRLVCNTNYVQLAPDDRVAQASNAAFDAATFEIWGALLHGAGLVGIPRQVMLAPHTFAAQLRAQRISTLFLTTALFNQLARDVPTAFQSLRHVLFGGEAVDPHWVGEVLEHGPPRRLLHVYGPTESTTFATWHLVQPHDLAAPTIAIGRALANTQVYVLDRALQPVPPGVPGELYIGGDGLARGYLNRPDLTAERFIPNPFAGVLGVGCWVTEAESSNTQHPIPNTRLYKTGDLVRHRLGGAIEFLGRVDYQVKIRGFRIEPEEIDAVLARHPWVEECAVLVREDVPGERELVAYLVPRSGHTLTVNELQRFLKEHLPEYMVPATFVPLDRLPLTPNGKIDRRALLASDQSRIELEESFVAPRTPVEELLAGIWTQVLHLDRIGVYDNFFALGGDSIRSIQVMSRAEEHGLRFSLQQLFQHQTIHELAQEVSREAALATAPATSAPFDLVSAADRQRLPEDVEDAYPLTKLQIGMLFHSQYRPLSGAYHDIFNHHLQAPLDRQALETALEQLVAIHPILRTSFDLDTFSEPLQLVHRAVAVPLEVRELYGLDAAEQQRLLDAWFDAEKERRFDWQRAPLLRLAVHRFDEQTFHLGLSFHHAILDGWSLASMLTELFQRYFLLLGRDVGELPPLPPIVFRDFVKLERDALESDDVRRYWIDTLSGYSFIRVPRWPTARQDIELRGREQIVPISPDVSDRLKALAEMVSVPVKSVLLAAHLRVMSLLGGQTDILTGLVSNGRPEVAGGAQVLGLFLNTLPFRLRLPGGAWTDLVREVFAAEQELIPFRWYPMALLQHQLGGQPLFETAFNFVHFHVYQGVLGLSGIEVIGGRSLQESNFTLAANFGLDLVSSQVMLTLEYDAAAIDGEQIAAIAGYYARTLAAMTSEPHGRYETWSPLSEAERQQLLAWSHGPARSPRAAFIHRLFEAQVARTPDAVALVFDRPTTNDQRPTTNDHRPTTTDHPSPLHPFTPSPVQHLTYHELNVRANQLAHYLRDLGVEPEVRVGLWMERSVELVIGMLGVLKAGGAYVPLDPAYPAERLAFMLEDARAAVLLTTNDQRPTTDDRRPTTDDQPTTIDDQPTTTDDRRPTTISDERSTYGYDISYPNDEQRRSATTCDDQPTTTDVRARYIVPPTTTDDQPTTIDVRARYIVPPTTIDDQPTTTDVRARYIVPPTTTDLRPASAIQNPKSKIVNLSADWPAIAQAPALAPISGATAENLAYLIYTSGSTGRPKAVLVEHRSLAHILDASQDEFGFQPADVMPWLASAAFDIALFELFSPLLAGGRAVVLSTMSILDLPQLLRILAGCTVLHGVPSLLQQVVAAIRTQECAAPTFTSMRLVCVGGDLVPPALLGEIQAAFPAAEVCVLYGPTEGTIIGTRYRVPRGLPADRHVIGTPLPNVYLRLCDAHGQPVPVGVPGELFLGGAGLARGYLNRLDLTAERFIPNPFGGVTGDGCWVLEDSAPNTQHPTPNTRLYKTGDLARYLPDGNLEFLGRTDAQVKVRGFRIELGEVEAVLGQHPSVREAVVTLREDAPGERRLVAYVVPKIENRGLKIEDSGSDAPAPLSSILYPLSSELRRFLQARLPDYMVPSAFVLLDALPLTANGKLDRRALPAPDTARSPFEERYVAPRTTEETLLAQIWADVLQLEHVGVHDSFFTLGGHSLLATQIISRVRNTFQIELPIRALFEAPTVAGLAEQIALTRQGKAGLQAPPIHPVPRTGAGMPLSFAQERLWFLNQLQPNSAAYNLPAAVRLGGRLDVAALRRSLTEVADRHESLRTTFATVDGRPIQIIARAAAVPLSLLDLTALPAPEREAEVLRFAATEAQQPFDLAHGPLVRATMLQLDAAEHVLLLTMHHIVSDAWSTGVLVGELAALYQAGVTGQPAPLPALPVQYADYAVWQRSWLLGSGVRGQGSGVRGQGPGTRGQGATAPLPPPAGGGTEEATAPLPPPAGGGTEEAAAPLPPPAGGGTEEAAAPLPPPAGGGTEEATAPLPPPAGGGTEGGRSQESDVGEGQIQNSKLKTQNSPLEVELSYWRQQLAGLPVLRLPTDRPRPPIQTFRGGARPVRFGVELTKQLNALGRQSGTTPYMTLLAAFAALLARYSGQDDIPIGSSFANRTRHELEGLIGFFVNTLVLRANLGRASSFGELLARVRQTVLDALAHQDLPFEQLVEDLQPARTLSHNPLFQVFFALQNAPIGRLELPDLTLRPMAVETTTAQFDLLLSMQESAQGLEGALVYSTDLFDAATIERMVLHLETLLSGAAADPARRIAELPLLTAAERQQLLVAWNATEATYPRDVCVHQLFAAQAARSPDAIALVFAPTTNDQRPTTNDHPFTPSPLHPFTPSPLHPFTCQQLTYHELNRRAALLARHLRGLGVGPEVRVALCLERSPELVVAVLGVLKAGGAYVPLEPGYPAARLTFMLEDSQAPIVLTQARLLDELPAHWGPVVCLDSDWDAIARQPEQPPDSAARTENLAYVIYTSGSTGQPKGVMIPHRGLVNYLCWCIPAYNLAAGGGAPLHSSIGFDLTITSLFAPLLAGRRVELLPEDAAGTALGAALLREGAFSLVKLTPTHLDLLAQQLPASAGASPAQALIVGGEALRGESLAFWRDYAPATRLINEYGPTETVVGCCVYEVPAGTTPAGAVPIGRPIANTQLYILDAHMQPVPLGVAGELYIGGAGLAHGYLNRPDLTAEKFIPNPFAGVLGVGCWVLEDSAPNTQHPTPNTRLYRTGDLARYLPDGNIAFLGRLDEQVKLRGYRVELGEVEAILRQHPAVQECVVLAREDTPGDTRLVAYIVPKIEDRGLKIEDSGSSAPDPLSSILYPLSSELRGFLQDRLPAYMVPSAFVVLEALPLTPNGKLDRRALPAPDQTRPMPEASYAAPRTEAEALLAQIWSQVLSVAEVGVHDNFFALGGHSLLATQVVSRVYQAFGIDLPLGNVFEAPTVAGLAQRIVAAQRALPGGPLRARPGDLQLRDAPLSFEQQRLWFFNQMQPDTPANNLAFVLRLTGRLDGEQLPASLSALVRRHESLRTTVMALEDRPLQVVAPHAPVALRVLDLEGLPAAARDVSAQRLVVAEARMPFDLSRGPLLRLLLLRLDATEHALLVAMHQIISDDWSSKIFVEELAALYSAAGQPTALPDLPITYADYALWQREWLQGERLDALLAYWKGQLGGQLPVLELPSDRPRPPALTFRGATIRRALPGSLAAQLKTFSRQAEVTLFMTLLGAFQTLIYRYTGQTDILLGTPSADRPRAESEGMIGSFANMLVLRTDMSGEPLFTELLRRVRGVTLDAFAHQGLPFELLVDALQPERDLSRMPLFQVAFALNTALPTLELPDLILRPTPLDIGTAQFDLSLIVEETAGGLVAGVEYSTDLFEAATIARLLGHFQTLLEGIVAQPGQPLVDLPLLTDAERRELLDWNASAVEYPQDVCLHQLFAAQAEYTPDAVALVFDGLGVRGQGSGVRGQGIAAQTPLPPPAGGGTDLPPPAGGGTDLPPPAGGGTDLPPPAGGGTDLPPPAGGGTDLPPPAGGGTEGGGSWASATLSPPSSILHPQSLTYRELNIRANRLAHHLHSLGVGPEVRVGLYLERSPELLVGLLGILKAGGAYVPLDPLQPVARLAFMFADAQAPVLVTQESLLDRLPTQTALVVCLDGDWASIAATSAENPASGVTPADLAYLIYTSGSTGRPKAVMVEHRQIVNTLCATQTRFALRPGERMLGLASFAFDIALFECLTPLLLGGATIILTQQQLLDLPALAALLDQITFLHMMPSLMQQVVHVLQEQRRPRPAPHLRGILLGGDVIPTELVQQVRATLSATQLYLGYGPTEGTIITSCYPVPPEQTVPGSLIGTPLPNMRVRLYDTHRHLVPIGVPGEIYIGGVGVTRGYLHQEALTDDKYVWIDGQRWYRSGDLGRYRADGMLLFQGRLDEQVKVRGYRIELGEIETVIGDHPAVRECVVMAREDVPGEKRLVAYVVPKIEDRRLKIEDSNLGSSERLSSILYPLSSELRDFLKDKLPDYMVPATFVLLEALPVTPNGKIDRRALPAVEESRPELAERYVGPRTAEEALLVKILADLLRLERVGIYDNFFALGGHSLLATQVITRMRDILQVELPLSSLFEAPTAASLAARLESARNAGERLAAPPIMPVSHADPLPLSFAQQRIWFLEQIMPSSSAYIMPVAVRFLGQLDVAALQHMLDELVRRHEALRTTFPLIDGRPYQLIGPAQPVPLPLVDLARLPVDEQEAEVQRLAREETQQPFDLENGPMLRTRLLRLGDAEHVLLFSLHHIASDGWSLGVLVREVTALYGAYVMRKPAVLPRLPVQYADYAVWQRAWLQGPVLEAQLAYWKAQLADLSVLRLPSDRPRPPIVSYRGTIQQFDLPSAASAELLMLSRREGATLFMTLLAAWQVLLARYSGQDDIAVGTPIANRTRGETEGLIGFFVNTLVLRGDLSGNPTFQELLARARAVCLGAYAHQDLPFEQVVDALDPPRDLSRHPLFQVFFSLQNTPAENLDLPDLQISMLVVEPNTAKFDLSLSLIETPEGLGAGIEYNTDLFDAATITRMQGHLRALLEGIVAQPDQPIGALPILSAAEQEQLLVAWNDTRREYPRELCFHELFEAQVRRTSDAVAVVFDRPTTNDQRPTTNDPSAPLRAGQRPALHPFTPSPVHPFTRSPVHPFTCQLTYQELNRRANQLAHYLQALGVGPDVVVALLAERGPDFLIAMLALFKAGGAYLPLDPQHPVTRHRQVLEQSAAALVLATRQLLPLLADIQASLPAQTHVRACSIAELLQHPRPAEDLALRSRPGHLAYTIYTSGSTGVPKGAMVEQRGMLNHLYAKIADLRLTADDCVAQNASQCFDISVWQFLATLLLGGRVRIFPDDVASQPAQLLEQTDRQGVSILELVPSMLRVMLDELLRPDGVQPALTALRWLVLTGEALPPDLCQRWLRQYPHIPLLNAYGPTECSDDVTHYRIDQPPASDASRMAIGYPVANTQLYILDARLQPVPAGVIGELYVGGDGVGRGYLNRPDLTAAAFIPNPFAEGMGDGGWGMEDASPSPIPHPPSPGTRLYKTGDLARHLPDGRIDFLGRADQQVKIHGFRIELGEIEAVLAQHPAVREQVVLVREDLPGNPRLVVYVVPKIEDRRLKIEDSNLGSSEKLSSIFYPLSSELRSFLKERLPAYMVPAAFVELEALPLTPNGKIDRKALPAPDQAHADLAGSYAAPRTPVEERLAAIWATILRLDRVGIHDNFFALGGDSILSIQVVARANQAGLRITPRQMFEHQTIAALAAVADTTPASAAEQGPVSGPLPLTPIQQHFLSQGLPNPHHFNQALLFALPQPLDGALLTQAVARLLRHHDALRLRFVQAETGWQQINLPAETRRVVARCDLSALPALEQGAAIERVAAAAQASLNLIEGPLVRVVLFELGAHQPQRLLIVIHHMAVDGVSWRILLEDLQTAYEQLGRGAPVVLPAKTTSFRRWAARLADYAQSAAVRQELNYWLGRPWSAVAGMPVDDPAGANTQDSIDTLAAALSAEETQALLHEIHEAYHTQINDVLLTALAQAFAAWTGARTLLVDMEGHGREALFADVDLSRTVGWFTSLYPVLLDLEAAGDPGAELKAVKEQFRAIPNHGVGYGLLRYLSAAPEVAERLRDLPQATVVFNYLGQMDQTLSDSALFQIAPESSGPAQSSDGPRPYLLVINAVVAAGQLRVNWAYSTQIHRRDTIEHLAQDYLARLRALIAHCRSPEAGGYTPSDFSLAKLNQKALDTIVSKMRKSSRK